MNLAKTSQPTTALNSASHELNRQRVCLPLNSRVMRPNPEGCLLSRAPPWSDFYCLVKPSNPPTRKRMRLIILVDPRTWYDLIPFWFAGWYIWIVTMDFNKFF